MLCVPPVKPQPLLSLGFVSPLTPAGQERVRGWVSGCSTSLWVPLTLPTTSVLNSLPFRGSLSVLLRPCLTYPPQLVPLKLRGNVLFLDSWLRCQRLPRSPRSEASALVLGPARKPPADLQWCRRTIQLNSRLQSKHWFASVSPSHLSSALSFCWNSRASDFCQRASLSLGKSRIRKTEERIHENNRIISGSFQKTASEFPKTQGKFTSTLQITPQSRSPLSPHTSPRLSRSLPTCKSSSDTTRVSVKVRGACDVHKGLWQLQRPAGTDKGHQLLRCLNDSACGHWEFKLSRAAMIT